MLKIMLIEKLFYSNFFNALINGHIELQLQKSCTYLDTGLQTFADEKLLKRKYINTLSFQHVNKWSSVSICHQVAESLEVFGHLVLRTLPCLAVLRQDDVGGEGAVPCNFLL